MFRNLCVCLYVCSFILRSFVFSLTQRLYLDYFFFSLTLQASLFDPRSVIVTLQVYKPELHTSHDEKAICLCMCF